MLFFFASPCKSQEWLAEAMVGTAAYNGDLTQTAFSFKRLGPSAGVNIKYYSGSFWSVRAGISYGKVSGDDSKNRDEGLKSRNLSFKSHIVEFSICGELAAVDPELYYSYPYIFGGIGVYHFNPFSFDDDNKKTFLRPLSTEGQGLAAFPDRKPYSLFQVCVPFGAGWKYNYKNKFELSYEFGYRLLFTDYLDDVSKRYVSLTELEAAKGLKSAEMSYRRKNIPFQEEGEVRGNSTVKDIYFFSVFKIATKIGKKRDADYNDY